MFDWLFVLLSFGSSHHDRTGAVAVEAAYVSVQPTTPVKKKKVRTADCTTCNGTGRVRTGDDQSWTKCPDCEPDPATAAALFKEEPPAFIAPEAPVVPEPTLVEPKLPEKKTPEPALPEQKKTITSRPATTSSYRYRTAE